MITYIKELFSAFIAVLKSRYKWMLIFFVLWLYRVDFISADEGGLAKGLQVITIFGMLGLVMKYWNGIARIAYNNTNSAVKSILWLYSFAVISTLWAFMPTFAFFLSFQNIVLMLVLLWLYSLPEDFDSTERLFLISAVLIALFEVIAMRILETPQVFIHSLTGGSTAALLISYCVAEIFNTGNSESERRKLLMNTLLMSLVILVTSTSSGANASAIFGLATALLFSKKIWYAIPLFAVSIFLYLNPNLIESMILMVMPGKSAETLSSASGRQALWDIILNLSAQKPIFGWGYACIERAVTSTGFPASDAHNNYLGIYGGLGIIGCVLLGIHFLSTLFTTFRHKASPGYLGLFCATCCAILNGYSYGFLSGKACSITVVYFSIVILSFIYYRTSEV